MKWHDHSDYSGKHAFLSPSRKSWLNYDADTMYSSYISSWATSIGTTLHAFAESRIRRRKKLTKSCKDTVEQYMYDAGIPEQLIDVDLYFENLTNYVNDCIGFRMEPEKSLVISDVCFGTTDAINFDERNKILRISDYKSGTTQPSMDQLMIYAALFFIEYARELDLKLSEVKVELRIYYQNDILSYEPDDEEMSHVIDTIVIQNKTAMKMISGKNGGLDGLR